MRYKEALTPALSRSTRRGRIGKNATFNIQRSTLNTPSATDYGLLTTDH